MFCKNEVFNRGRYPVVQSLTWTSNFSGRLNNIAFCLQENSDIFLKINHSLLKMPKIVEIGLIFPAEKRAIQKHDQHEYK